MTESDWQTTWHALHGLLGAKWSMHVLRLLDTGSYGFNELKREIDGVTAAMLSRRLKELECHGFVDRSVEATTPPTTTYRLTEHGREFARHLRTMEGMVDVGRCEQRCECTSAFEDACLTVAAGCE